MDSGLLVYVKAKARYNKTLTKESTKIFLRSWYFACKQAILLKGTADETQNQFIILIVR